MKSRVLKKILSMTLIITLVLSQQVTAETITSSVGSAENELIFEADALFQNTITEHVTRFDVSGDIMVTFFDHIEGQASIQLDGVPEGDYELFIRSKDARTRSIFDVSLNDEVIGIHNQRGSGYKESKINVVHMKAGTNILRFDVQDDCGIIATEYEGTFNRIRLVPHNTQIRQLTIHEVEGVEIIATPESDVGAGQLVTLDVNMTNEEMRIHSFQTTPSSLIISEAYTFIMPDEDVEIRPILKRRYHEVEVKQTPGMTITANPNKTVEAGEKVTLTIDITDENKILESIHTSPSSVIIESDYTFTMPDENVKITGVLKPRPIVPAYITETETNIIARRDNYVLDILKQGMRYEIRKRDGKIIAPRHEESGLRFSPEGTTLADVVSVRLLEADVQSMTMEVETADATKAKVVFIFSQSYIKMEIYPYAAITVGEEEVDNQWVSKAGEPAIFISKNQILEQEYSVTVEHQFSERDSKFGAGPIVGYEDIDNFINVRAVYDQADTNKVQFLIRKNGAYTKNTLDTKIGTQDDILVKINGNQLEAYVKGVLVGTYDHHKDITGKVGYRSYKVNTKVDNFVVMEGAQIILAEDFDENPENTFDVIEREWTDVFDPSGENFKIEARTRGLGAENNAPVYGLGDYGGWASNANLQGREFNNITNNGHGNRFISTFNIMPSEGFAQVLFEDKSKRASFLQASYMMGVNDAKNIKALYYFISDDLKNIYKNYKNVREEEGYSDSKPHYEMFGVGFEAYGALHWNADEAGVQEYISRYLEEGYHITWGVIGSGFWKGDRKVKNEGATTSFGIWDDEKQIGRSDGLANPRFPNAPSFEEVKENYKNIKPGSSQDFFKNHNIKLLLGLRHGFKAHSADGGYYKEEHDGPYMEEGLANGYFLKSSDGEEIRATGLFPKGKFYILDGDNEEATAWYKSGARLWNVDGFKEDAMLEIYDNNDGNWNNINEVLTADSDGEEGKIMIVRNSAYSVPGDVLRINDISQNDPSRVTLNVMAYAASGYGNVYPDIIGANYSPAISARYNNYLTRNAIAAAVMPSLSLGRGAWDMKSSQHENAVRNALGWHSDYAPYIYDAILDGYSSGYPSAFTPLYIAYPQDESTYNRIDKGAGTYEWMLGESILAAPIFDNKSSSANSGNMATSRNIYLPEGKWMDYETGEVFEGNQELLNYELGIDKIPVFIGGKGILISEDWRNKENEAEADLYAEIYKVTPTDTLYSYTHPDGVSQSTIHTDVGEGQWNTNKLVVTDTTDHVTVEYTTIAKNDGIKFRIEKNHHYLVNRTGSAPVIPTPALNQLIQHAKRFESELYTDGSYELLSAAILHAEKVVENAYDENKYEQAKIALQAAIEGLVLINVHDNFKVAPATYHFISPSECRIDVAVQNKAGRMTEGTLLIALYDEQGVMTDYQYLIKSLEPLEMDYLGGGFKIPTMGELTIKAFVVDGFKELNVLSNIKEFDIQR